MNFRVLPAVLLGFLAGCDGSSSPENSVPPVIEQSQSSFGPTDAEIAAYKAAELAKAEADAISLAGAATLAAKTITDKAIIDAREILDKADAESKRLTDEARKEIAGLKETAGIDIEKAKLDILEKARLDGKTLTDAARIDAAKLKAGVLSESGLFEEAAEALKTAGLVREAATMLANGGLTQEAVALFKDAGLDAEAYDVVAPKDIKVTDPNVTSENAALDLVSVDETPGTMRHSMTINGKTVWFTAKAGHLIAYAQKDPAKPGVRDAQASIFYESYTRDDLPKEERPVTFLFNGGPGSASVWLHLGSWAPKRVKVDSPNILPTALTAPPESLPLLDNDVTLLDQTDLVFVDAMSTGYSQAIKPHTNGDYWSVDADAELVRDFITSYTNKNNRQSSPKYIYGESFSGIRVPIATKLLQEAGTSNFDPDPSGLPPRVFDGIILNSPILDYGSNVDSGGWTSINAGALPTYAMIGAYHKKLFGNTPGAAYAANARKVADEYVPVLRTYGDGENPWDAWAVSVPTAAEQIMLDKVATMTGVASAIWQQNLNMWPTTFESELMPNDSLGYYDGRTKITNKVYDPDDYEETAFSNAIKTLLPDFLNYTASSPYAMGGGSWGADMASSLPALTQALTNDPKLKVLILHGYYDLATPFYQTELDLKGVGLNLPVHMFEGGHMIYYSEPVRAPLKKLIDEYYSPPVTTSVVN